MARIVLDVGSIANINDGIKTGIPRIESAVFNYLSQYYDGEVAFLINKPTAAGFYGVAATDVINGKIDVRRRTLLSRLKRSFKKRIGKNVDSYRLANGGCFEPWRQGDCYLSITNIWERISWDEFSSLRNQPGLKIVLFCHDIAPIVMPYLYPERVRYCFYWCLDALSHADLVICNSLFTQRDLLHLAKRRGLDVQSKVVPLDASIDPSTIGSDAVIDFLEGRPYVLAVSSINDRKNHDLLLKLWASYKADPDVRDVCLVIVGTNGWGAERVIRRLSLDVHLTNRVFHLSDVEDAGLDWLYRNCLLTVYPSLYEGWGLPITESLTYGKVCVASSTTSMPEASHGLGIHIDPWDFVGWKETLRKLMTQEIYRTSLEQNIRANFVTKTWSSIAKEIIDCAVFAV